MASKDVRAKAVANSLIRASTKDLDSGAKAEGKDDGAKAKATRAKARAGLKEREKGVYGEDDQAWEQDLTQQQARALQPEWPPSAAAFAAPPPMPWMDAAQASTSAQDPWASWGSNGGWPPGVSSLTPKPRQISSLAMATPKPPVSTQNRFDALNDNMFEKDRGGYISLSNRLKLQQQWLHRQRTQPEY